RNPATQHRITGHLQKTTISVDLPSDGVLFDRDAVLAAPAYLNRNDHREAATLTSLCACTIGSHRTLFDCHKVSFSPPDFRKLLTDRGWLITDKGVSCARQNSLKPSAPERYWSKGQAFSFGRCRSGGIVHRAAVLRTAIRT